MKSQLGIFLNAPESRKTLCLIFQALHIENTLVKPSTDKAGKCFGSLLLWQDAAASLPQGIQSSGAHPAGANAPRAPSKWGTLVYTGSLGIFGKVFPISYNFHSRSSSTSQLHPPLPRLQESPSRASPAPLAFSLRCHMNTSELQCRTKLQFRHTKENGTPGKVWPYLRPLAVS